MAELHQSSANDFLRGTVCSTAGPIPLEKEVIQETNERTTTKTHQHESQNVTTTQTWPMLDQLFIQVGGVLSGAYIKAPPSLHPSPP